MNRQESLDRFYTILDRRRQVLGGYRYLAEATGRDDWPRRGVYFFFESGETREDGCPPRVVRVGTHALKTGSRTTLWARLRQHRGFTRGAQPGGGNHRGSVFRLHVGMAILNKEPAFREFAETWGRGSSADRETRRREYPLERAVSEHIRKMPFLWLSVPGEPGPSCARAMIEAGAIALLSNFQRPPVDPPSSGWLGRFSSKPEIRQSGLWNIHHVADVPKADFLEVMERYVDTP